jgi:hypothetical protein
MILSCTRRLVGLYGLSSNPSDTTLPQKVSLEVSVVPYRGTVRAMLLSRIEI